MSCDISTKTQALSPVFASTSALKSLRKTAANIITPVPKQQGPRPFMSSGSETSISQTQNPVEIQEKERWACDFCKKAKFDDYDEACRHEDKCKIDQIESLKHTLTIVNPKHLGQHTNQHDPVLDALTKLDSYDYINTAVLKATKIGKIVNKFKSSDFNPVASKAKQIIIKWKAVAKKEEEMTIALSTDSSDIATVTTPSNRRSKRVQNNHDQNSKIKLRKINKDAIIENQTFVSHQEYKGKKYVKDNISTQKGNKQSSIKNKKAQLPPASIFQRVKKSESIDNKALPLTATGKKSNVKQADKIATATQKKSLASIFSQQNKAKSKVTQSTTTKITKPTSSSSDNQIISEETSTAMLLAEDKAVLAEHLAVEFMQKRRKMEEERRMKKEKRERVAVDSKSAPTTATSTTLTSSSTVNQILLEDKGTAILLTEDKAVLAEHLAVEFMQKRRKIEEERRLKKQSNKRERVAVASKSAPKRDVAVASIFQRSSHTTQKDTQNEVENNERNRFNISTPNHPKIKGSGLNEQSPLDLTSVETPVMDKCESSSLMTLTMAQMKKDDANNRKFKVDPRVAAPKFPNPNHVMQNGDYDSERPSTLDLFSSDLKKALNGTARYQCGVDNFTDLNIENYTSGIPAYTSSDNDCVAVTTNDYLHSCFSSVLKPSPISIDDSDGNSLPQPIYGNQSSKLWSDRYMMKNIPHDIYGEENKKTAEDLKTFINDWRSHRQKAIMTAEQAHQARKGVKKRKKKNRKRDYDYDDDFTTDQECEDGLNNVYILAGPSGSGKTSLAHAVAKQCQCVTLEINTTVDRSGSALKKAIEECTQSYSTLAMLKKGAGYFGLEGVDDTNLQDTDDENEGNASPSLALILIDEVDLLFETDVGFWQSLNNLSKKAKCPIILTAQEIPQQLFNSSAITYRYAFLTKPTPMECASKMCQIAKMENMAWQKDCKDKSVIKDGLSTVARLCNCDMRKIMNEMQLYNKGNECTFSKASFNEGCSVKLIKDSLLNKKCNNIDQFIIDAQNASDAALLEDTFFHIGLPTLTGAVSGCAELHDEANAFSSDFNDNVFTGSTDTFMTRPMAQRDRFLLSTTCEFSRGKFSSSSNSLIHSSTPTNQSKSSDQDDTNNCWCDEDIGTSMISDEDNLLAFPTNLCALSMPIIVRNSSHNKQSNGISKPLIYDSKLFLLESTLHSNSLKSLELVKPLFSATHAINFNNMMTYTIALDYIPFLRTIAILEMAADKNFEVLLKSGIDKDHLSKGRPRRSSRREETPVRDHYFDNIMGNHFDSNANAKSIAQKLSEMQLTSLKL